MFSWLIYKTREHYKDVTDFMDTCACELHAIRINRFTGKVQYLYGIDNAGCGNFWLGEPDRRIWCNCRI